MIIQQFARNVRRGPVEIMGEFPEIWETARLFGFKSPTAWRVSAFAIADVMRGKLPTAIIAPSELETLYQKTVQAAAQDIDIPSSEVAGMMHTLVLATDHSQQDIRAGVIGAVLDHCAHYGSREQL